MKEIYYCIVEKIEVDENATEDEISDAIAEIAEDRSFMWARTEEILMS